MQLISVSQKLNVAFAVGSLFLSLSAYGVTDSALGEKAVSKETHVKEKDISPKSNADFPHSGEASPKGKTAKEREDFLRKETKDHPDSYKDTKEYKSGTAEQRAEMDKAVERNKKALDHLREKNSEKEKKDGGSHNSSSDGPLVGRGNRY